MYNRNSPAVIRLMKELSEMQKDPSSFYTAAPHGDDLFEWHFSIRGPKDTEFEGGIYHGRILLPAEFPYRPPDIIFLTKNGRFEVGKKICLTISSHHEETWNPNWTIRTVLIALIAFMPTRGDGAIASLDWPIEERKRLAKQSVEFVCDKCGIQCKDALREEVADERLKTEDVPADLKLADPSKKRTYQNHESASSSSSPPPASSSSSLSQPYSPSPIAQTASSSNQLDSGRNGAENIGPPSTSYTAPVGEGNDAIRGTNATSSQPTGQAGVQTQPNTPAGQILRDHLDMVLSVLVLFIGLILVRKLFMYM